MTKHPHHHAYPEGSTDLAVSALLTVWSSLADYHDWRTARSDVCV